ncbi:uncharacterized protein E2P81_ATG02574 [Venturia nashicola]|uniref:C2H2-type domain-containing protein n=1 Tax=Venturia nashicola TaxID=86259 RepID=A0A4Z1PG19_9PEZI|nr:hypothetical protein E6O75_ATG02636 [Venturia nashicola]TLD36792.1 uncharacterized protein E2P81_ATG02574 [Venturia nashicola]
MTAAKDTVLNRTSSSQNRLSAGTSASNAYKMHPRTHSHSLSVGSLNPTHRVTRRKSTSASAANQAAAIAAIGRDASGNIFESGSYSGKRGGKSGFGSKSPLPASLPSGSGFGQGAYDAKYGSAIADGPALEALPEMETFNTKGRSRRASDGSQLRKGDSKRDKGGELKCETCGKGYKHSSCLTKHLWEHTPEWQLTSKLLISKHQQVQLLEAASVLVAMNVDGSAIDSDASSPAASGSSDPQDSEMSSAETTPPPQAVDEAHYATPRSPLESKRISSNSSAFSQSYQSSVFSESMPNHRPYMSHYRQWSNDGRPTTSGTSVNGGDESREHADLAAAVGLLSCSFGTPKTVPVMLQGDIPPVPPVPTEFQGPRANYRPGAFSGVPEIISANGTCHVHGSKEVDMEEESEEDDSDHEHRSSRARSDEDDEGMFGSMEE